MIPDERIKTMISFANGNLIRLKIPIFRRLHLAAAIDKNPVQPE